MHDTLGILTAWYGKTATAIACCPPYNSKLQIQAWQWQLGVSSISALITHDLADVQCTGRSIHNDIAEDIAIWWGGTHQQKQRPGDP